MSKNIKDIEAVVVMATFDDCSVHQFLITKTEIEKNGPKQLGRLVLARLAGKTGDRE